MKLSKIFRWVGPAAIVFALFLVVSDMSGMPMPLLDPEEVVPTGSSVIGSGLILWALVLLLVGMIGLYARLTEDDTARKAAEREARYGEWELDEEFECDAPESQEAEELPVSQGFRLR